jgi:serine/threonine protein phosphatase PrpC
MPRAVELSYFGASVTGPEHRRQKIPNQDAWVARKSASGCVAIVADGLGSSRHGRIGAQAACVAGQEAARILRRTGARPTIHTIAVLRAVWHQIVASSGITDCGTTCLFTMIDPEGVLFAAQVGDGLIAIRRANGDVSMLQTGEKSFQNSTSTIASAGAQHWALIDAQELQPGDAVFMATDGIADDLDMTRLGDFVGHLISEYLPMPTAKRSAAIRRSLDQWPTRHHRDDKTLVVIVRTQ